MDMKFDKQSDAGVSPVVGVILMVAITVILSAIIATFVLDLGGTVSQNPQAGVTFDQSIDQAAGNDGNQTGYQVDVQVVSMENADQLDVLRNDGSNATSLSTVGGSATVDSADGSAELTAGQKITVTGTLEGKTQVIQTYTVRDR